MSVGVRSPSSRTRLTSALMVMISIIIVVVFIFWVGNSTDAFRGFPKGVDPYSHMTKIEYILQFFPYHDWQYHWAAGTPLLLWYAPLFYYFSSILVKLGFTSIEGSLFVTAAIALLCIGIGVHQLVYTLTKDLFASLVASLLALTSPAIWNWFLGAGLYPRFLGLGFIALSVWWVVRFVQDIEQGNGFKGSFMLAIVFLSLSLQAHLLTGHLAIATALLITFFGSKGLVKRMSRPFFIGTVTVLLTAYFYLPFLLSKSASRFTGHAMPYQPAPLIDFFNPLGNTGAADALSPLLLPLLVLLLILLLVRRRLLRSPLQRGVILALFIMSLLPMAYAVVGYFGFPSRLYIDGLVPPNALGLAALFAAMLCGVALGILLKETSRGVKLTLFGSVLVLICLSNIVQVPLMRYHSVDESDPESEESLTARHFILGPVEKQYRFAIPNATQAIWFNYQYEVPQSRDYIGYGILIPDWRFWFDKAIWDWTDNLEETDFLLNWFAIKWISIDPPRASKYEAQPSKFPLLASLESPYLRLREFEYVGADPILRAANASMALILGGNSSYDTIFRGFANSNYNSQYVIPLRGKEYIDDYTLEELSQFDVLLLYGYRFRDQGRAFQLLADYVRNGGGLIVEANGSPFDNSPSVPEPIPVSRTTATNYGTQWSLTGAEHEILEGVDLSLFGPGIYDEGPWGLSSVEEADIRPWAEPILFVNGYPIIVVGEYGEGRVVWTGINLPYHVLYYHNPEESRLLARMVEWVAGGEPQGTLHYEAQFVDPQKRVVNVLSTAKGVLFKECFFPNWHVYLDGQEVRIYRAGPDFMYVPLPEEASYPLEVVFEYRKSVLEWASIGISLATLVGLIVWAVKR